MDNGDMQIAFVALWNNKASEYHATANEKKETSLQIEHAFANAQRRGVRMFGRYGCRYSSEYQYFTFWVCPSFEVCEETMSDLEAAGDFKFADSEHIIGKPMSDEGMIDDTFLVEGGPSIDRPIGFFAMWRKTDAYYNKSQQEWDSSDRAIRQVFDMARSKGVRMLGRYDCRWSTEWEYFTFWQVPSIEILDEVMDRLESAGDFMFAESRHLIGNLEASFRFGRHLVVNEERAMGGY